MYVQLDVNLLLKLEKDTNLLTQLTSIDYRIDSNNELAITQRYRLYLLERCILLSAEYKRISTVYLWFQFHFDNHAIRYNSSAEV